MAEWVNALVEGLASIRDDKGKMQSVTVSPRWAAAGVSSVRAVARYAPSNPYFAYKATYGAPEIAVDYSGSGSTATFRVLLPDGWKTAQVSVDDREVPVTVAEDSSAYALVDPGSAMRGSIRLSR